MCWCGCCVSWRPLPECLHRIPAACDGHVKSSADRPCTLLPRQEQRWRIVQENPLKLAGGRSILSIVRREPERIEPVICLRTAIAEHVVPGRFASPTPERIRTREHRRADHV